MDNLVTFYFPTFLFFSFLLSRGAWTWLAGGLAGCKTPPFVFFFSLLFLSGEFVFVCYKNERMANSAGYRYVNGSDA